MSEETIQCNNKIGVAIDVNNKGYFPFLKCICHLNIHNIYYNFKNNFDVIIPCAARKNNHYPVVFDTSLCGTIMTKLEAVEVHDWCGLFYLEFINLNDVSIDIMPSKSNIEESDTFTIFAGMQDNEDTTKTGNEYSDVNNIREYIPGDRIKDIHWKLSVKKDELLVKERIKSAENKINIFLDSSNNIKINEAIIRYAYNLMEYSINVNILVNLYWYNYKINGIDNCVINTMNNLKDAYSKIYSSSGENNKTNVSGLISRYDLDVNNIILIGYKEGTVGAFLFEE